MATLSEVSEQGLLGSEDCVGTGRALSVCGLKGVRDVEVFKEYVDPHEDDGFQELG